MDPFMQHVPASNGNGTHTGATDEELDIKPRQAVLARHKFRLEHTGSDALVRHMPLARLVTLTSLSPSMYPLIMEVFGAITGADDSLTQGTQLDLLRKNDALIDGACQLGFIKPRLVGTQEEADAANDPYVWCIDEVDPRDRQAYFDLVTNPEVEAAKVVAPFPENRVEDPRPDESGAAAEPAERAPEPQNGDEFQPVSLSVV